MVDVPVQRAMTGRGKSEFCSWHTVLEALGAPDVSGVFQLARMNTNVAVRSLQDIPNLHERQGIVRRQRAHNAKPHTFMNQMVRLFRLPQS